MPSTVDGWPINPHSVNINLNVGKYTAVYLVIEDIVHSSRGLRAVRLRKALLWDDTIFFWKT